MSTDVDFSRMLDSLVAVRPDAFASRAETLGLSVKTLAQVLPRHGSPGPSGQSGQSGQGPALKGRFAIVGVPDDRGVVANGGHPGASAGPHAFRSAFYKLYDTYVRAFCPRTHRPYPNMEREASQEPGVLLSQLLVDAGDVRVEGSIQETHARLSDVVANLLGAGAEIVFVIGGGHDFSYGSYVGHARAQPGLVPIVNLDGHFDLRPVVDGVINSGTPFFRIIEDAPSAVAGGRALLELGLQRERNPASLYEYAFAHGVVSVEYLPILKAWRNIADAREVSPLEHVLDHLDACAHLGWGRHKGTMHLSLDLDVFASWIAPGTSAATPMGAVLDDVGPLLSFLGRTHMCKVVDIAELSPARDFSDQTARLAASLVYTFALLREEYAAPEDEADSQP